MSQAQTPVGSIKLDATKLPEAHKFCCHIPASRYIFKNGKVAAFMPDGKGKYAYVTNLKGEVDELEDEILQGHPTIYVPEKEEVAPVIEPMEALRARFFKEFQELQARALDKTKDLGNSLPQHLTPANSTTVNDAMAGSHATEAAKAPAGIGKIVVGKQG